MAGLRRRTVAVVAAITVAALLPTGPAGAQDGPRPWSWDGTQTWTWEGLLDHLRGLVGVAEAGWDDGVATPPTSMAQVRAAIGAKRLWDRGFDGTGVDVAVIDTGVVPVAGLAAVPQPVNGADLSFESQSPDYQHLDTYGHGTHIAGIIAGHDGAPQGFRGVAPGARLLNVKVGDREGAVDVSQVIAAIDWVVTHRRDDGMNIRVLNLAYGTDGIQDHVVDPLAHAVESAWRHGITVVVAGGNDGSSLGSLTNPAHDPHVLAVGAVDLRGTVSALDDRVPPFSSRGSATRSVDLVAPGVSIASLRNPGSTIDDAHPGSVVGDDLFRGSGTSQAAAVVSGAAALLLDARPDLTPDQVKALLKRSATPLLLDGRQARGAGRLDVDLASRLPVPFDAAQRWPVSTGLGLLDRSRGTERLAEDGVELAGEIDIMGTPWDGAVWAPLATAGTAWSDGVWNGVEWTGTCWCTDSWSGKSWTGKSWTGKSWTGKSWTGALWAGKSWTGKSWTGKSWTGKSWTGKSWTGKSWTGKSWTRQPRWTAAPWAPA